MSQLVFAATTTIERREKLDSDDALVLHRAKMAHIKFSRGGAYQNFCHVFGPNPYVTRLVQLSCWVPRVWCA